MTWTDAMDVHAPGNCLGTGSPPVGVLPTRPSAALAARVYDRLPTPDRETYTTIEALAELTGATPNEVRRALRTLRDAGFVEPHERGWRRTPNTPNEADRLAVQDPGTTPETGVRLPFGLTPTPTENPTMTEPLTGPQARERRLALGMTQQTLARQAGVHGPDLSAWEKGRRPLAAWRRTRVETALLAAEVERNTTPASPSPTEPPDVGTAAPAASGEVQADDDLAALDEALGLTGEGRTRYVGQRADTARMLRAERDEAYGLLEEARTKAAELATDLTAARADNDMNSECIGLIRQHLADVGIERPFADDVAVAAATEIRRLRTERDDLRRSLEDTRTARDSAEKELEAVRTALDAAGFAQRDGETWEAFVGRVVRRDAKPDNAPAARPVADLTEAEIAARLGLVGGKDSVGRDWRTDTNWPVVWELPEGRWFHDLEPGPFPAERAALLSYAAAKGVDLGAPPPAGPPTLMSDAFPTLVRGFRSALADYRAKNGRDAVRKLAQGKLLDALDAGAEDTWHDQSTHRVEAPAAPSEWTAPPWLAQLLRLDDGDPVTQADVTGAIHDLLDPIAEAVGERLTWSEYAGIAANAIRGARAAEQPAPTGGEGDCWAELINALDNHPLRDAMIARRLLGLRRYGVPLGRGDGRDADRDLREELLDAAVYAQRLLGRPGEANALAVELLHIAQSPAGYLADEERHADETMDEAIAVAGHLALAGAPPGPLPGRVAYVVRRVESLEHDLEQARQALELERNGRREGQATAPWSPRDRAVWRVVLERMEAADLADLCHVVEALTGAEVRS